MHLLTHPSREVLDAHRPRDEEPAAKKLLSGP